jgi:hypothetical protein
VTLVSTTGPIRQSPPLVPSETSKAGPSVLTTACSHRPTMLSARAIKLLEATLADVTFVVPADHLAKLQAVPIVLDLTHGKLHAMQYHPSPEWLQEHGYARELAKCVHICEAADFVAARQVNEQPWVLLHELAHAYHDHVLGFDDPRIVAAYERFKESGHGDSMLLITGQHVRHYGLTDPKEFFAEMTEAYFGMNDSFPFNRVELAVCDSRGFAWLATAGCAAISPLSATQ